MVNEFASLNLNPKVESPPFAATVVAAAVAVLYYNQEDPVLQPLGLRIQWAMGLELTTGQVCRSVGQTSHLKLTT